MKDEELVQGCIRGNPAIQSFLYRKYAGKMMGVCLRYASGRTEAEDLLQQGFIKVFLGIKAFRGGSLEGWIRKIMVNEALDQFRKNKNSNADASIPLPSELPLEGSEIPDDMAAAELMGLIQQLPDNSRMVFNMYAIEGYSHQEIAGLMKISEVNSRLLYHRARQMLQHSIQKEYPAYGKK